MSIRVYQIEGMFFLIAVRCGNAVTELDLAG